MSTLVELLTDLNADCHQTLSSPISLPSITAPDDCEMASQSSTRLSAEIEFPDVSHRFAPYPNIFDDRVNLLSVTPNGVLLMNSMSLSGIPL